MNALAIRAVLLDIEGTTSSISFVYDVMFPFARREMESYLNQHWDTEDLAKTRESMAHDAGHASFAAWSVAASDRQSQIALVHDEAIRLMDDDVKATGLKQLQGLVWRSGFASGELQAHVYDDVPPALEAWHHAGLDVRIFSSGSVQAQKLFFGHTIRGDLLQYFCCHYDTTTGPKQEPSSYEVIAADFGLAPAEILFISDIVAELDAARGAGLQTVLCVRPGNPAIQSYCDHTQINDFTAIHLR